MLKKIVLFAGGIETLWYFSIQMGREFEKLGLETFFYDLRDEKESFPELESFCEKGATACVSFNFNGCSGEKYLYDENDVNFFEKNDIPLINIVVDHPFYYHKFLPYLPKDYTQLSIDLEHEEYLKRFFPEIKRGLFLPLAGTGICGDDLPGWDERNTDVVFTGNYNPPENYGLLMARNGPEYEKFYRSLLDDFIEHPSLELTSIIEEHIRRDIEDADEEGIKETMPYMIFIDLYIRHYFRGKAVRTLVDAGIPVSVYGAGWETLEVNRKDCLIIHDMTDSLTCLERIKEAKISLNVMPWFKRGAHDRVFNSMLNGAVCVTDRSEYLDEVLSDCEDVIFYDIGKLETLPDKVRQVLSNRELWEHIQREGYNNASKNHSWAKRADDIYNEILIKL
ncbi:MAG: glycosyltransferase [Eubacterium sp.]|nr:glycosyltransferase [Eubacterium sp.]